MTICMTCILTFKKRSITIVPAEIPLNRPFLDVALTPGGGVTEPAIPGMHTGYTYILERQKRQVGNIRQAAINRQFINHTKLTLWQHLVVMLNGTT